MKIITRYTSTVEFDGLELVLPITDPYNNSSYLEDAVVVGRRPDGWIVLSYLVYDEGRPDLDPLADREGVEFVAFRNGDERDYWIDDNLGNCDLCGWEAARHPDPNGDTDCPEFVEKPMVARFREGRAFWVERYEHGLVRYALMGESSAVDRRWDVAGGVGVLVIDDDWTDPAEAARGLLAEYTDWCNGEVYGVVHAWYAPEGKHRDYEDFEDCWGFIGRDHALATMQEEHDSLLRQQ